MAVDCSHVMALWFTCSLLFGVAVAVNNLPQISFNLPSYIKIVPESTAKGTVLFTVTATDSDLLDTVVISTANAETSTLVTLDPQGQHGHQWTATVLLESRLDRDRSPTSRPLLFQVSDGHTQITGKVTLVITDVNDNPPFFINLPYRLELPERTNQTNSTVYTVTASDPDEGPSSYVVYSMSAQAQDADEEYSNTFVVYTTQQANQQIGEIRLERELDFESRSFYQYQVTAKDRGSPSCPSGGCLCSNWTEPEVQCDGLSATFTVTVTDVQDTPPLFLRQPYITTLLENASIGTDVLNVHAMDGDRGVPNRVNYTIEDEEKYPFTVNSTTGMIQVKSPGLDADTPTGRSYFITVLATEVDSPGSAQFGESSASTQVSITVGDVNDNGPLFGQHDYWASVLENSPQGINININTTVRVSDQDQNTNSQFRVSVEKDGDSYPVFSTRPSSDTVSQGFTTVTVSVNLSSVLDYEQVHNITFQIRAQETETTEQLSDVATIHLSILDTNDNSPQFSADVTSSVNVTEHTQVGKVLARLSASDRDSGDYGTVGYYLENDFSGLFSIGETSGELRLEKDIDRDDGQERFSLVVLAKDNINAASDDQRRSTRHTVDVFVQDTNDNAPRFLPHIKQLAVQENAETNTTLITLKATDADIGENGDVTYHVISIQRTNPSSSPSPTTSLPQLFDIRATTGEVFVSASLIGHPGLYDVTFMASDTGQSPLNSSTSVAVEVRDVNLNPPKFVKPNEDLVNTTASIVPSVTIREEEPLGTFITQLLASDADTGSNGQVLYYLDPDLATAFLSFRVNPLSGNLSNRARLDCDQGPRQYQINLRAQDQGTPISLSSVIPFIVHLEDIDDNEPQFPPEADPLRLAVKEQTANVRVGLVNITTDKDRDPENRVACYYLYGGQKVSSFQLDPTSGELRLLTKLDRLQTLEVSLMVKTTRNCSLPQDHFTKSSSSSSSGAVDRTVLEVNVGVEDVNNHPPVFDRGAMTVGLLYDVPVGTELTDLTTYTSDQDTAEHSRHMYRLLKSMPGSDPKNTDPSSSSGGQSVLTNSFSVSVNGSVLTNRLFRADEAGNFVLTVQAYDVDNLTDTANLTIYLVSDLQRVKLIFNKDPNEVNKIKGDMVRRLGEVLGMTIIVDKIATHLNTDGTPDPKRTDVFIHARYVPSGEIVPTSELVDAFDYKQEVLAIFQEYGVAYISPLEIVDKEDDDDAAQKVFIIVIIVLAIITLVLIVVLVSTARRYRRRLRAATTSAFVSSKSLGTNPIPPGTNKYFTSENPLFGKDMRTDDFNRILDKDSDSLDNNAVVNTTFSTTPDPSMTTSATAATTTPRPDPEEEQEMRLDMYDDDLGPHRIGTHNSHLAMVLKEYDSQIILPKTANPGPPGRAFSTTLADGSELWKPSVSSSSSSGQVPFSHYHHHAKTDSGIDEHEGVDLNCLEKTDL